MSLQIVQNQQLKPIGDKVPIDTTLSSSSENAISNKAVNDEITRINSDLTDKLNRSWTYIDASINGANITFDLSNYNEVCLLIYTDVGSIQLAFTESFPIGFISDSSRVLRGAGGYGTDLDCYQMTISKNELLNFHIFVNGTENTSSSLVQVYAR